MTKMLRYLLLLILWGVATPASGQLDVFWADQPPCLGNHHTAALADEFEASLQGARPYQIPAWDPAGHPCSGPGCAHCAASLPPATACATASDHAPGCGLPGSACDLPAAAVAPIGPAPCAARPAAPPAGGGLFAPPPCSLPETPACDGPPPIWGPGGWSDGGPSDSGCAAAVSGPAPAPLWDGGGWTDDGQCDSSCAAAVSGPSPVPLWGAGGWTDGGCNVGCGPVSCGPGCGRCYHRFMPLRNIHAWLRPHPRTWGRVEFLLWWHEGQDVPPLVTASPAGTDRDDAAVLPGATILLGDEALDYGARAGERISLGYWFDPAATVGIGGRVMGLDSGTFNYRATPDTAPIFGRPFFNTDPGVNDNDALLVVFPEDNFSGTVDVSAKVDLLAADAFFRATLGCCAGRRTDLLLGYQFTRFDEDLVIRNRTEVGSAPQPVFNFVDSFDTKNEFHGVEFGCIHERPIGCWNLELLAKVALGNMHERVRIRGERTTTVEGLPPVVTEGGLLAQISNIGEYSQNSFAAVPELNVNLGYHLSEHVTFTVGYSLMVWSDLVRPGDQIDTQVDGRFLIDPNFPGTEPQFLGFNEGSHWVQGLNLGFNWRY